MSKVKEQKLPKWFDGEVYDKGAVVQNRFGGAEIELNNVELSMYDFVIGASIVMEMSGGYKHINIIIPHVISAVFIFNLIIPYMLLDCSF